MKTMLRAWVVACVAAMLICSAWARAQVLDQVPDNVFLVVKINNPQAVNDRVVALFKQMGLANLHPAMGDPLGALKQQFNIKEGLDLKGEAALAFFKPGPADAEPRAVALVPVSDYVALMAGLAEHKKEGNLDTFKLGDGMEAIYATQWGKYAAVTPWPDLLANKPAGLKLTGAAAKQMQEKDVAVWVDMKWVRDQALPTVKQIRGFIEQMPAPNEPGRANAAFQKAMGVKSFELVEMLLEQTDAAAAGLSVAETGLTGTLVAQFAEGSVFGNAAKQAKNTSDSLVAGLPQEKYLLTGGWTGGMGGLIKWYGDTVRTVPTNEADMKAINEALAAAEQLWASANVIRFGITAPELGAGRTGGIIQGFFLMEGDGKAMLAAQDKAMRGQDAMMKASGNAGINVKAEVKPGAKKVAGVSLDEYILRFSPDPNSPPDPNVAQMIQIMYGDSMISHIGLLNDKLMFSAIGMDDVRMEKAITAAKQNANALGDQAALKSVDQHLPKERVGVMYIGVDHIVATVMDVLSNMGMGAPIKVPPDLPPMGVSFATEETAIRIDGHIPAQLIENMVSIGMQIGIQQAAPRGPGRRRGGI